VQGAPANPEADRTRQRHVVEAFLAASREGNFEALLAVLDPDVVFRADPVAARMGGIAEIRGAAAVAETFKGRAQAARPALVDRAVGVAVMFGGQLRIVLRVTIADGRVAEIEAIVDPARLGAMEVTVLGA
jgi:RNA polymerase sigma-70 factor (ECF subfamily)